MKYIFLTFLSLSTILCFSQDNKVSTPRMYQDSFMIEHNRMVEKIKRDAIGTKFRKFEGILDGKTFSYQQLEGKIVFINFWFSSCLPCIAEFPYLNEMYTKLKDTTDFELISFTFESQEKIQELKRRYGLEFKIIHISQAECYRLNFNLGFPTNVIIDRNGIVKYIGPTDEDRILERKDYILTKIQSLIIKEI